LKEETIPIKTPISEGSKHDKHAPFWAAGVVILGITGLATNWLDLGSFWKSYVLDITGPAWNYILFRGRFTSKVDNRWTRFFTPKRTVIIFIVVCTVIEGMQYLKLYEATFDIGYLERALELNKYFTDHFWDDTNRGFYLTADKGESLLVRQKDILDYFRALPELRVTALPLDRIYTLVFPRPAGAKVSDSQLWLQGWTRRELLAWGAAG